MKNLKLDLLSTFKQFSYITIPICLFLFWAIFSVVNNNFKLDATDYIAFYSSGRKLILDPEHFYDVGYYYLPSAALFFIPLSMIPYEISAWIFYFILIIFGVLSIILFDKILRLKNVEKKLRIVFLLIISNGYKIIKIFDELQPKYIPLFLILLFIVRDMKFLNQGNNKKYYQFFFTQTMILTFAVGMIPALGFLILIYMFNNIKYRDFIKTKQIKKYFIFIFVFLLQNFWFILFPLQIVNFINIGFNNSHLNFLEGLPYEITYENIINRKEGWVFIPADAFSILYFSFVNKSLNFNIPCLIIMGTLSLMLTLNNKLSFEKKVGYYALFSLFLNIYILISALIVILPLVLILFIEPVNNINSKICKILSFHKLSIIVLISMICISMVYFIPTIFFIYTRFPFLKDVPLRVIILIYPILYFIIAINLLILKKITKDTFSLKETSSLNNVNK